MGDFTKRILSSQPSRKLTSRECASLLCGQVGSLLQMSGEEAVLDAIEVLSVNRQHLVSGVGSMTPPIGGHS